MFDHLQIHEPRERWLVGLADVALAPLRLWPRRRVTTPRRVLLLRLERIGDLLMVIDAIRLVRLALPEAEIDLAVGSWNVPIALRIPGVTRVETLDAPWLARGERATWGFLSEEVRDWRGRYDLVINFEPDIRSNLLAWLSQAPRRAGYWTGGGGAFLTEAHAYAPDRHTADNARELVARTLALDLASPAATPRLPRLSLDDADRQGARALLATAARPLIGVHVSGGRESKQWHLDRFGAVARELVRVHGGTIVLTGTAADRPVVDRVKQTLTGVAIVDACGALDLPGLAALLAECDLFVTGDTGPMHLAAAVGTPVVAIFGPSDPRRYAPLTDQSAIVRVDLWCSPCGQVRLPPERCRGHVPDCLDGITVERVVAEAGALLARHPREEAHT